MNRAIFFMVFLLFSVANVFAQLTDQERSGLERALRLYNLNLADLGYEKRLFHDRYRLPLVDQSLIDPLGAFDVLCQLYRTTENAESIVLTSTAWSLIHGQPKIDSGNRLPNLSLSELSKAPEPLRPGLQKLLSHLLFANQLIGDSLSQLTASEKRDLLESLPRIAAESENVVFSFVSRPALSRTDAFALLEKVDLYKIALASEQLSVGIQSSHILFEKALPKLKEFRNRVAFNVRGLRIVIGGMGDDHYREYGAAVVLDTGGNDLYSGRIGAGIFNCGVLLDLGGDDIYRLDDLSGGAGVLGCGFLYDGGGHDTFYASHISLGAGIAGSGFLHKRNGDATYRSQSLTQGFGMFGVGLLVDESGDGLYSAGLWAQGSSRTRGVGWLIDRQGDDIYSIGGIDLAAPLLPDSWYGFGQGFSMGYREDTGGISGGIGILMDYKGSDSYRGGAYVQAASYWFSLGVLMEGAGHDSYSGYHYCQSSAMHFTSAYLVDYSGDDLYGVKWGAAHAIGHDYGVAFLLDRSGNDVYAAKDTRPGLGNANGVGIFIESSGEDRYGGTPGLGNPARGSGSIGVFVDLSGSDLYMGEFENGEVSFSGMWGVSFDILDGQGTGDPIEPLKPNVTVPIPGSAQMPSASEMSVIYDKATQWGVGSAAEEVTLYTHRLIEIGLPAFEWMMREKLRSANRLQLRAFDEVIRAIGEPAKAIVAPYIASSIGDESLNALRLCQTHAIRAAGPYLPRAIENPSTRLTTIRVIGEIQATEMLPLLITYANSANGIERLAVAQSLGKMNITDTIPILAKLCEDKELPIRKSAVEGLSKFPEHGYEIAMTMLSRSTQNARLAIELLGAINTEKSLATAAEFLQSPEADLRVTALIALHQKNTNPSIQEKIKLLVNDSDENVRLVARWVLAKE